MRLPGVLVLAIQDQSGAPSSPDTAPHSILSLLLDSGPVEKTVMLVLLLFSAVSWGVVALQAEAAATRREADRRVPRGLPQEQPLLRSAGGVRESRREPARGLVPFRIQRTQRTAAIRRGKQAGHAGPTSNPEEPGGRGSCITAGIDDGTRQTRTSNSVPGDDCVHHAVHRVVRHRVGHHDVVSRHRGLGPDESRRSSRRALPARSSRPRPGLFAAIPAVYFYNDLTSQVKALRERHGRLLDGVPDDRGSELHVEAERH